MKKLFHNDGEVVCGVRHGGIAEVSWGALLAHARESPKKRTVEHASKYPSLPVYVNLLHDEAIL